MIRVGVLKIDFHISDSRSLKEKRVVLRRMRDRISNNFNVSISEIDNHDKWQIGSFGISYIANDKKHVDGMLNKVKDFFQRDRNVVMLDCHIEII